MTTTTTEKGPRTEAERRELIERLSADTEVRGAIRAYRDASRAMRFALEREDRDHLEGEDLGSVSRELSASLGEARNRLDELVGDRDARAIRSADLEAIDLGEDVPGPRAFARPTPVPVARPSIPVPPPPALPAAQAPAPEPAEERPMPVAAPADPKTKIRFRFRLPQLTCACGCGQSFVPGRKTQKFASPGCRLAWNSAKAASRRSKSARGDELPDEEESADSEPESAGAIRTAAATSPPRRRPLLEQLRDEDPELAVILECGRWLLDEDETRLAAAIAVGDLLGRLEDAPARARVTAYLEARHKES